MNKIRKKSVLPIYLAGLVWSFLALILPLYRLLDFLIIATISVVVYFVMINIFPAKEIELRPEDIDTKDESTDEILKSGLKHINELNQLRETLLNHNLSSQVQELESISQRIFKNTQEDPNSMRLVSEFFYYYLPTTVKLLKNYNDFERQGHIGANVTSGMREIEGMMGSLVVIYRKVLDNLFEEKSMDVSIDVEILNKMLNEDARIR